MKLDELVRDLKEGHVFGRINGGLPHAHILLFMHPQFKPQSPDDIDKYISAEIPNKENYPKLYAAFEKFIVHGPCGH